MYEFKVNQVVPGRPIVVRWMTAGELERMVGVPRVGGAGLEQLDFCRRRVE